MRKLLCVMAVLALAAPVLGAPVVNGDFETGDETGWTRWRAPWGNSEVWSVGPGGNPGMAGTNSNSGYSSHGWYQRVPVIPSEIYTLVGDWTGDVSAPGWAELGVIICTEGMTDGDIVSAIDGGQGVVAKKDGWGLNPPDVWGWESITNSLIEPNDIHMTCAEAVVFTKIGSQAGPCTVSFDNIELVPEPTAALLLGLPILFLRRRR